MHMGDWAKIRAGLKTAASLTPVKIENHSHAWKGAWERPVEIDENEVHPFTVARMTDHNVRGPDQPDQPQTPKKAA